MAENFPRRLRRPHRPGHRGRAGFGAEIAVRAAQEGAQVVVHYNRSREGAEQIGGLAAEGCAVARALGITLDDDPLAVIDEAVTYAHRPSMLQDVLARRPTEIDVLNGGIVRGAREAGVPVPLNQAVTALINGLEQSWAKAGATAH